MLHWLGSLVVRQASVGTLQCSLESVEALKITDPHYTVIYNQNSAVYNLGRLPIGVPVKELELEGKWHCNRASLFGYCTMSALASTGLL